MRAAFLAAGGLAAAAIGVPSAFAQEDDMAVPVVTSVDEDPATEAYPELLENTLSVEGDIDDDAVPRTTLATPQPELTPWFAFKQRFEARTGISFGGSYGVLAQIYSDSLAGSGLPTAATWGDFNLGITQAYIRQSVAGGKFQYTVGKIFAPNFVNPYPFFDDNRQFLRLAFSTSPTIATPCAARVSWWRPIRAGAIWEIYVKAGMFTANSDDTGWTVDDFFGRDEHFYFVEVGATSFAGRCRSTRADRWTGTIST